MTLKKTKKNWCARQESNLYQELRKLSFYPLNYRRQADDCSVFSARVAKVLQNLQMGRRSWRCSIIVRYIIERLHARQCRA